MKKFVILMALLVVLFSGFGCSNQETSEIQKQETKSEYEKCLEETPLGWYVVLLNNEKVYFQPEKPEEKDSAYLLSIDNRGTTMYVSIPKEISHFSFDADYPPVECTSWTNP